jgi:hypothetical protein
MHAMTGCAGPTPGKGVGPRGHSVPEIDRLGDMLLDETTVAHLWIGPTYPTWCHGQPEGQTAIWPGHTGTPHGSPIMHGANRCVCRISSHPASTMSSGRLSRTREDPRAICTRASITSARGQSCATACAGTWAYGDDSASGPIVRTCSRRPTGGVTLGVADRATTWRIAYASPEIRRSRHPSQKL